MDAILNINSNASAFSDQNLSNNPKRRYFDWTRNYNGVRVHNPKANSLSLYPGETKVVFDGQRTLTADATTAWSLKSLGASLYRFSWTGGTVPGMRIQRALNFSAVEVTVTVNNNSTVTLSGIGLFANVQTQDSIYISLPTDPNPSPFNPGNTGFWTVLSASPDAITLARPVGQSFSATSETVVITNTAQGPILAYSATGVQVGDVVDVSGGFQTSACKSYTVTAVTSNWFEVESYAPLADEVGVAPGTALTFYTSAKSFVRIEVDQEALVYINGSTVGLRILPIVGGDGSAMGWFENHGAIWTLSIANRSAYDLNINAFSAE